MFHATNILSSSLLPIVGPFIGTLIGGYYAQDEFSKGNKKTGVLIGILSFVFPVTI